MLYGAGESSNAIEVWHGWPRPFVGPVSASQLYSSAPLRSARTTVIRRGRSPRRGDLPPRPRCLERLSLTWVDAFRPGQPAGFAHAAWDRGTHALILDTVVRPAWRRRDHPRCAQPIRPAP